MATTTHYWQSLWEETIRQSSNSNRIDGLSNVDRINLHAELVYKNFYSKRNLDDLQRKPEFGVELNRLKRFITKDSSVLDIGAGFGRIAVPLAKEVRRLTAVEPARIYMKLMKDKAGREGVGNIEFAEDLWSDFPLRKKYDFVYSTLSLAISDPDALMKMNDASRGYCALELGASPSSDLDFNQIYSMVKGESFRPPGNYLNIITTLYDNGIYANLETWEVTSEVKYETVEDLVELRKTSLKPYVRVTEEMEEMLHRFYRSKMNSDGTYVFHVKGAACMIWWKV